MGLLHIESIMDIWADSDMSVSILHANVYNEGTDNRSPIYTDSALTNPTANPVCCDENGYFDLLYVVDGRYRIEVTNQNGDLLYQETDVRINSSTSPKILSDMGALTSDKLLSYDYSDKGQLAQPGDIISVAAGNFAYEVVDAGRDDYHLQTVGGLRLRALSNFDRFDVRAFGAVGDGITDDTACIRKAVEAAEEKGGIVHLPAGVWLISETIVLGRSITLSGMSKSGGTRGGGIVNHPCTIIYTGTGAAIQLGTDSSPCINSTLENIAIVVENGAENYRNFTGILAYDLRKSRLQNIYVEGADKGYLFTGQGGAVAYVETSNLNARDCNTGLETECPTPIDSVSPFMQANLFGLREVTYCGVGVRLGGGQQNHSRIDLRAAEIGGCDVGLLLDGDGDGERLTYQIDGQGWFEKNSSGNIVLNAGILYVSGDITNSDNNVTGGIIHNGGRLIPMGRLSFDDYSLPFRGFTTAGLVRAFSFIDEGGETFHCPISGAMAKIIGDGGSKVSTNTRYGDGVQGDGSGGGLRMMDTSFDWTNDWTVAILAYLPATSDEEVFKLYSSTGPSRFEINARPGFARLRVQDAGSAVLTEDLGGSNDNPLRAPCWMVVSYDSTLKQLQFRSASGSVASTWEQEMPAGLSSNAYQNWSLNGSISQSNAVIDELLVYDRVLDPEEVSGIFELRTNVCSTIGRDPRAGISRCGDHSVMTDADGAFNIPHGLLDVPTFSLVQIVGGQDQRAEVSGNTNIDIEAIARAADGSLLTNSSLSVCWRAEI